MRLFFLFLLFALSFLTQLAAQEAGFEAWKKGRVAELTAEGGWINLAGLYWLEKPMLYLNEVSPDSLTLSEQIGKKNIGSFQVSKDSVWFVFHPKIAKKIKSAGPIIQYPATSYSEGAVSYAHWKWSVIQRGGLVAVRLRDLTHPGLKKFEGIPVYNYDPNFRVKAFFEPKFNETMQIPNVLGQLIDWKVMGILKFEIGGQTYRLTALDEAGKLFVIFSDETSGTETYPTGRYLYVNYPEKTGMTEIDFNYAYNPPCAFTAFATCPIPPKVNRLPLALRVGEKDPKGH